MSFKMRIAGLMTAVVGTTLALQAQAQYGYGMAPAMASCPYPSAAAPGATSMSDDVREAQDAIKEAKRKLTAKKSEKKRVDRDVERYEKDITDVVEGRYADFILQHMQNGRSCGEYFPQDDGNVAGPNDDGAPIAGNEGGQPIRPKGKFRSKKTASTEPFSVEEWGSVCMGRGGVSPEVCREFRGGDSRSSTGNCQKAIPGYRTKYAAAQKLQDEIENLERSIERLNDDLKDARQAAIDERKAQTEGGICIECMQRAQGYTYQQQQPNYLNLALGVGMGLAGMYAGYQTNKTIAQYNSNIGYPTQQAPLMGLGYGLPFFQAGLAGMGQGVYGGVAGGIGQGGFGCAGPMGGMGGVFGNPYMNSGMPGMGLGGGMYMPGYNPYGGMGGMGMGMPGMGGMMGMNPYGMGGLGMGMPGMGMMNPYGMGGLGGGGIGAGFGMNPYGMGGMGMGMPGMGMNPYGMGIGGGLGMGMNPYGMGGMPGMGLGMGMNPYGMGGMPGMGMGGMGMDPMAMQMQQMQMQQYQQYMQSQQAAMQDAMNRQRVVAGLQSEMYGLMNRIQQAQMGIGIGSSGGSYLGAGYNSGTAIYSGSGAITGGIGGAGGGYLATPYTQQYPYTQYPYSPGTTATTPLGTGR